MFAIANPAPVFTPIYFSRIRGQIRPADMMMGANLSATQAQEEAFRHISAAFAIAIGNRIIDVPCFVTGMEGIQVLCLIGINGAASCDTLMHGRDGGSFGLGDQGNGPNVALSGGDDGSALAGLIFQQALWNRKR